MKKYRIVQCVGLILFIVAFVNIVRLTQERNYTDDFYDEASEEIYKEIQNTILDESFELTTSNKEIVIVDDGEVYEDGYTYYGELTSDIVADVVELVDIKPTSSVSSNSVVITYTGNYIYIPDTNVCYPLVQGDDNTYYLKHLPNGKESNDGSIFINYLNNFSTDFNVIIYGHNMKSGKMFGQLKNYYNVRDYAKLHNKMVISYNGIKYDYELFSVQRVRYDSDVYSMNPIDEINWIETQARASVVNTDSLVDFNSKNKFITLSTCSSNEEEKVVIIWKRV